MGSKVRGGVVVGVLDLDVDEELRGEGDGPVVGGVHRQPVVVLALGVQHGQGPDVALLVDDEAAETVASSDGVADAAVVGVISVQILGGDLCDVRASGQVFLDGSAEEVAGEARRVEVLVDVEHLHDEAGHG